MATSVELPDYRTWWQPHVLQAQPSGKCHTDTFRSSSALRTSSAATCVAETARSYAAAAWLGASTDSPPKAGPAGIMSMRSCRVPPGERRTCFELDDDRCETAAPVILKNMGFRNRRAGLRPVWRMRVFAGAGLWWVLLSSTIGCARGSCRPSCHVSIACPARLSSASALARPRIRSDGPHRACGGKALPPSCPART
jgi:hypothetical protein